MAIEEYKFLRQEHENNRRYVFERPLVILGLMATISATLMKGGVRPATADGCVVLGILGLFFMIAIDASLWLTHNRLRSSARIVAYVRLVHDKLVVPSMRWETALHLYRAWLHLDELAGNGGWKKPWRPRLGPGQSRLYEQANRGHSFRYYKFLWWLHVIMAVAVLCAMLWVCMRLNAYSLVTLSWRVWVTWAGLLAVAVVVILRFAASRLSNVECAVDVDTQILRLAWENARSLHLGDLGAIDGAERGRILGLD